MKTKKLLALIMALAMLLSSLPMAFADAVTEPEEPISEWGEFDLSDAAGEPVVEEGLQIEDGEPVEEPEETELVKSDANYNSKFQFIYNNPAQADATTEDVSNGNLTAELEAQYAPKAWEGHTFDGWQTWDPTANEGAGGWSAEKVELNKLHEASPYPKQDDPHKFNATWKFDTFTVQFQDNSDAAANVKPLDNVEDVEYGATLTAEQVEVTYVEEHGDGFDKYAYDYDHPTYNVVGVGVQDDITAYPIKANTNIKVTVPKSQVDVVYKLSEDATDSFTVQEGIVYGETTTAPDPAPTSDEHKTFKFWTADGEAEFAFTTVLDKDVLDMENGEPVVREDGHYQVTLIAAWDAEQVPVTYDPNNDDEPTIEYVNYGEKAKNRPVVNKEGHSLMGWLKDGATFNFNTPITEAITLTADWKVNQVKLTYEATELDPEEVWPEADVNDGVTKHEQTGDWNTVFEEYDLVTRTGYTRDGWTDGTMKDGKPVKFNFEEPVKANATLKAIWKPNDYNVVLNKAYTGTESLKFEDGSDFKSPLEAHYGNKLVAYDGNAVEENEVALMKLKSFNGHTFLGWYYTTTNDFGDTVTHWMFAKPLGEEYADDLVEGKDEEGWIITEALELTAAWDEYYTVTFYDGQTDGDEPQDAPYALNNSELTNSNVVGDDHNQIELHKKDAVDGKVKLNADDAAKIYAALDGEATATATKGYFEGFFVDGGATEFDLVNGEVTGDLVLKTKRTEYVTVKFDLNGGNVDGDADDIEMKFPKGTTFAGAANLRGAARFAIPAVEKDNNSLVGWTVVKNGEDTLINQGTFKFDDETTLKAFWQPQVWDVTIDLDGGAFADAETPLKYQVLNNGTLTIMGGNPVKANCLFDKWVIVDAEGNDVAFVQEGEEGATKVTKELTVIARWTTFVAKDAAAAAPETYESEEALKQHWFESLEDALAADDVEQIVLLQDLTGEDAIDQELEVEDNALATINLSGKTFEFKDADSGINAENPVKITDGNIEGGFLKGVVILGGNFEDVEIEEVEEIQGGFFRWSGSEEAVERYVDKINDSGVVTEGKKLHLQSDGYYTPTAYKTLTIYWDESDLGPGDEWGVLDVFAGEQVELPDDLAEEIEEEDEAKFDKWLIYDEDAEEGAEPAEFTFPATLTEDTVIYGTWIEKVYLQFVVSSGELYYDWWVETYSDQLIEEPVEPTEEELDKMTNDKRERAEAAWALINDKDVFIAWQYERNNKNVAFGVDKAQNITINAKLKNAVTFYGIGNKVIDVVYVTDNEYVGLDRVPEVPEEPGYTFNGYWLVSDPWGNTSPSEIFTPANTPIVNDTWVVASYGTGNWAISLIDESVSEGTSEIPAQDVIFGGDEKLNLVAYDGRYNDNPTDEDPRGLLEGRYYAGFQIEAPNGIGIIDEEHPNVVPWSYQIDDEGWKPFNANWNENNDGMNGNKHVVMWVYREITWEMLKDLVDNNKTLTWTIKLAPTADLEGGKEPEDPVVLTATLDPQNVSLYEDEGDLWEDLPVRAIINHQYKFTVTFDTDGGAAITPIECEYGDAFYEMIPDLEIAGITGWKETWQKAEEKYEAWQEILKDNTATDEEKEAARKEFSDALKEYYELCKKIKPYFILDGFGYYENPEDKDLVPIEEDNDLIVRGNQTVYAMYEPIRLLVAFFDEEGELATISYSDEQNRGLALGSAMDELVVPEDIIGQYGTDAWYPVKVELTDDGFAPVKDEAGKYQVDKNAYDFSSKKIIGDEYYDADQTAEKNDGYIIMRGIGEIEDVPYPSDFAVMGLMIGEQEGYEVMFLGDKYDKNHPEDDTYYPNGDLTFGDIVQPEVEWGEYDVFHGWCLVTPESLDDDWRDLQPFKWEQNATKSVKDSLVTLTIDDEDRKVLLFVPSMNYTNPGTATLCSANVRFEGMIHLLFTYQFSNSDPYGWDHHYVVFRLGDEELARYTLNEYSKVTGDGEDARYQFACPVPIVLYTDDINVTVEDEDGEEWDTWTLSRKHVEGGYDMSLQYYAEAMAVQGSTETMKALAKSLQDYGIAARIHFKKDVGSLTLSEAVTGLSIDDMDVNGITVDPTYNKKPGEVTANLNVAFDADNTLMVKFGNLGNGTYTYGLDTDNNAEPEMISEKAVVKKKNIAAKELNDAHTFSITDGTDTYKVSTSVLGYAKGIAASSSASDSMKNLAKALYVYAKAAKAHLG